MKQYVTPPYTKEQMEMGRKMAEAIEKAKEGKTKEQGIKDARALFFDRIKIEIPNEDTF